MATPDQRDGPAPGPQCGGFASSRSRGARRTRLPSRAAVAKSCWSPTITLVAMRPRSRSIVWEGSVWYISTSTGWTSSCAARKSRPGSPPRPDAASRCIASATRLAGASPPASGTPRCRAMDAICCDSPRCRCAKSEAKRRVSSSVAACAAGSAASACEVGEQHLDVLPLPPDGAFRGSRERRSLQQVEATLIRRVPG
jgi:hypothetical protein